MHEISPKCVTNPKSTVSMVVVSYIRIIKLIIISRYNTSI